jgi:hypothetical protein
MQRLTLRVVSMSLLVLAAGRALGEAAEVPFEPCDGMICLPVTLVDGKSHRLLLDTGNINSWLTLDTAQTLHVPLDPVQQNGKALAGVFRLGALTVSLAQRPLSGRFVALSPEQTGELPHGVEGALAYTLFKDLILQIDYPQRKVRVLDPPAGDPGSSGAPMTLITFGTQGPPIVVGSGFRVNGKSVNAQIDTCFTGTLLVYDRAIAALGLQGTAAQGRPEFFPYTDGGVNMNAARAANLSFGAYTLAAAPATIYFPGAGKLPVHQPDGLFEATVGNALFAHSVVTLDFHAMRVNVQRPD